MSSKKRTKSSKKPTKKVKHALSPIEKELLDCCEKRQPVLLHGKDDYDREKLVRKIHSLNDGINREWVYEGNKSTKRINSMREVLRRLGKDPLADLKRKKLYKGKRKDIITNERIYKFKDNSKYKYTDKGYENEFNKYMLDCNDTPRTYKYDDWYHKSGQAVSDDLSKFEYKKIDIGGEFKYDLLEVGSNIWRNHPDRPFFKKQYERSDTKELLKYKGTLFIDKLRCKKKDSEDENGYVELALKIESIKKDPRSQRGWLVLYTRYRSTFPPEFIEQFEPEGLVLLNSERTTTKSLLKGTMQKAKAISGITKKRGRKPKNPKYDEFMEITKDILEDDKNASLGGYVIKVKAEMKRKGLKDEKKKNGLIFEDSTIRTYIQDHSEYKKIQDRKE